jgi:hypothetical protein
LPQQDTPITKRNKDSQKIQTIGIRQLQTQKENMMIPRVPRSVGSDSPDEERFCPSCQHSAFSSVRLHELGLDPQSDHKTSIKTSIVHRALDMAHNKMRLHSNLIHLTTRANASSEQVPLNCVSAWQQEVRDH